MNGHDANLDLFSGHASPMSWWSLEAEDGGRGFGDGAVAVEMRGFSGVRWTIEMYNLRRMELERLKLVFLEVGVEEGDGGRREEKDGRRREERRYGIWWDGVVVWGDRDMAEWCREGKAW